MCHKQNMMPSIKMVVMPHFLRRFYDESRRITYREVNEAMRALTENDRYLCIAINEYVSDISTASGTKLFDGFVNLCESEDWVGDYGDLDEYEDWKKRNAIEVSPQSPNSPAYWGIDVVGTVTEFHYSQQDNVLVIVLPDPETIISLKVTYKDEPKYHKFLTRMIESLGDTFSFSQIKELPMFREWLLDDKKVRRVISLQQRQDNQMSKSLN